MIDARLSLFSIGLAWLLSASAVSAQEVTLVCQGPKIESLRLPFSGREVGSEGTTAAFEVVLNPTTGLAWLNGKPARDPVFSDTDVSLSARFGAARIRIDRLSGAWRAAGGGGVCTPIRPSSRLF